MTLVSENGVNIISFYSLQMVQKGLQNQKVPKSVSQIGWKVIDVNYPQMRFLLSDRMR